jgi:hypothetical protein
MFIYIPIIPIVIGFYVLFIYCLYEEYVDKDDDDDCTYNPN